MLYSDVTQDADTACCCDQRLRVCPTCFMPQKAVRAQRDVIEIYYDTITIRCRYAALLSFITLLRA